jgi:hypothetical protein
MLARSSSRSRLVTCVLWCAPACVVACSASERRDDAPEAPDVSLGDGGFVDGALPDAEKPRVDGGYLTPDGGVLREDRFVTEVVSFTPGDCAGFGAAAMPDVVKGPPVGAGELRGGLDVVSLGLGGEIVVAFGANAIVDGPGDDFIVFENAFYAAGDPNHPAADLGEVSVSDDGETWHTFPCTPGTAPPYGACSGWTPVYSAPGNGISPVDPDAAGGESYDLATLGLSRATHVRIRDIAAGSCDVLPKPTTAGFDLDAVAIVNAAIP